MNIPRNISKEEYFENKGYEWCEVNEILKLYKKYKRTQGNQDTVHHRIPKVRGGSDVKQNRVRVKARQHWDIHGLFGNKTPGEQFDQMLGINSGVLKKEVRKQMGEIIHNTRGGLYIPSAYS